MPWRMNSRGGAHGHINRVARARRLVGGLQQRAPDAAALVRRHDQRLRHAQPHAIGVRVEAVQRAEARLRAPRVRPFIVLAAAGEEVERSPPVRTCALCW